MTPTMRDRLTAIADDAIDAGSDLWRDGERDAAAEVFRAAGIIADARGD